MAIENIKKETFIVTLHDERHTPINPKEVPKLAIKAKTDKQEKNKIKFKTEIKKL